MPNSPKPHHPTAENTQGSQEKGKKLLRYGVPLAAISAIVRIVASLPSWGYLLVEVAFYIGVLFVITGFVTRIVEHVRKEDSIN